MIRHLHDPYPQPHQLHLHHQQRRRSTGNSSLYKRACYENRDSEHGPSSESIPNSNLSSRDVDQGQVSILTTDSTRLTQSMQDLSIDKRVEVVSTTTAAAADKMRHSSETHGTVRKVPVSEQRQKQGHEAMRRSTRRKLVVTETLPTTTALTTAKASSSTMQASDAASSSCLPGILPQQHHQPSKRLSRLLHPTPSVASTPSITRIISQPVLTAIDVSHSNFKTDDHVEQRHLHPPNGSPSS
ncbi:MAG: hypothetical protein J3Q66DRAFT_334742 [Benniella sp.]|nr:MAG: hypothetical protein J3Q66DRAFT_334742 [Benniella sp.]